jgi:hypothetical protein
MLMLGGTGFKLVMDERLQSSNARDPIKVTFLGIVTVVKPLHLKNAKFPIEVTLLGIVMEAKLV